MAVDVVKSLKIENPATGGTQTDMYPTECNPAQDFLGAAGLSLQGLQTVLIQKAPSTAEVQFIDAVAGTRTVNQLRTASQNSFDNSTNGWIATNVQTAIEEAPIHLRSIEVSSTAAATAGTGADALMTGMTITATAGTYICWFSCDINSPTSGAAISVSFYNNGTQDASSLRKIVPFSGGTLTSGSGRGTVSFQRTITITTGALEVRWSSSSAGPTAAARTFTMLRVL